MRFFSKIGTEVEYKWKLKLIIKQVIFSDKFLTTVHLFMRKNRLKFLWFFLRQKSHKKNKIFIFPQKFCKQNSDNIYKFDIVGKVISYATNCMHKIFQIIMSSHRNSIIENSTHCKHYCVIFFSVKKYGTQHCDLCQQCGIRFGACNKQCGIERVKRLGNLVIFENYPPPPQIFGQK